MSEETVSESQFSLKTAALRVFDLPLSWYYSFCQVKKTKKQITTLTKFIAQSILCLQYLSFLWRFKWFKVFVKVVLNLIFICFMVFFVVVKNLPTLSEFTQSVITIIFR